MSMTELIADASKRYKDVFGVVPNAALAFGDGTEYLAMIEQAISEKKQMPEDDIEGVLN